MGRLVDCSLKHKVRSFSCYEQLIECSASNQFAVALGYELASLNEIVCVIFVAPAKQRAEVGQGFAPGRNSTKFAGNKSPDDAPMAERDWWCQGYDEVGGVKTRGEPLII